MKIAAASSRPTIAIDTSVSLPFALRSLKTAIVPAGAVAGAREAKIMDNGMFFVNKYVNNHTEMEVTITSTINIIKIFFPIFLRKAKEKLRPTI